MMIRKTDKTSTSLSWFYTHTHPPKKRLNINASETRVYSPGFSKILNKPPRFKMGRDIPNQRVTSLDGIGQPD